MKPKLLDLFCGAGGTSMGYHYAGFEVEGVDIKPQPHYPFKFYQADALEFPLAGYDAYHASPPCQRYSSLTKVRGQEVVLKHPDLIALTRERLKETYYVIENVPGARKELIEPIMLCGLMFNLKVYRHRFFEINFLLWQIPHIKHPETIPSAGKGKSKSGFVHVVGHQGGGVTMDEWREAMGINWMIQKEISQAIPPAYTEYIGKYLMKAVMELKV